MWAANNENERQTQLKRANRACKAALKLSKSYRLYAAEAQRISGIYHWIHGNPDVAQESWKSSLAVAGELGQHFELGVTHLEMGLRLHDRSHLERAETILSKIGAEWHLAQLRDALSAADK